MKRKFFLSAVIALLPLGAVFAYRILIHTSCGKTLIIESTYITEEGRIADKTSHEITQEAWVLDQIYC